MTQNVPEQEGRVGTTLLAAESMFERAIIAFDEYLAELQAGRHPDPTEAPKLAKAVNAALQSLFKESQKFDHTTDGTAVLFGRAGLDLDDARQEIERRMAGLRATRDPG